MLKSVDNEMIPEYLTKDPMIVKFERLRTKTIFAPLNYLEIYEDTVLKKKNDRSALGRKMGRFH